MEFTSSDNRPFGGTVAEREETVGDRVRMIRELRSEKQPEFAIVLNRAASRLGIEARYDNTIVSKMEVGRREVTLEDVIVISSVDKKRRGREWLAWGSAPAIMLLDPSKDRGLSEEEENRALAVAEQLEVERTSRSAKKRR
jgi:hypothetical protein